MSDEASELERQNARLKSSIRKQYRIYSNELQSLHRQNRTLEESLRLERERSASLWNQYSTRVKETETRIAALRSQALVSTRFESQPKNRSPRSSVIFPELQEDGRLLEMRTDEVIRKWTDRRSILNRPLPLPVSFEREYRPTMYSIPVPVTGGKFSTITESSESDSDRPVVRHEIEDGRQAAVRGRSVERKPSLAPSGRQPEPEMRHIAFEDDSMPSDPPARPGPRPRSPELPQESQSRAPEKSNPPQRPTFADVLGNGAWSDDADDEEIDFDPAVVGATSDHSSPPPSDTIPVPDKSPARPDTAPTDGANSGNLDFQIEVPDGIELDGGGW
jgi:hypothetical protein